MKCGSGRYCCSEGYIQTTIQKLVTGTTLKHWASPLIQECSCTGLYSCGENIPTTKDLLEVTLKTYDLHAYHIPSQKLTLSFPLFPIPLIRSSLIPGLVAKPFPCNCSILNTDSQQGLMSIQHPTKPASSSAAAGQFGEGRLQTEWLATPNVFSIAQFSPPPIRKYHHQQFTVFLG
ncbi:kynurenine 3-monooxygenase-like [Platysternon megacephalum]|uniref:Kynurenine 3-monooxygenase-like n=1 Tax=Platysternon megacephalum TaxID=55544 RepID=A0A4D9E2X4_9SAUR|nr:kynurenine 3-monooxygenase-like [Platysternon megacephalum]